MKIKVLTVTPALSLCGGIEGYTMNYYRNMSDNIEMDFITHEMKDEYYKKEITSRGGKVYLMPRINSRNLKEFLTKISVFFKQNHEYDIIHCNMANAAIFYFYFAKKYGIKVRILHSHQNNLSDKFTHRLRNAPLIYFGKKMATHNFACSKIAGDFLYKKQKYEIINNAIDVEKFKYNEEIRKKIRKKEEFEKDEIVFANIGRFCNQKNQLFLIEIFNRIHEKNSKTKLLLIGAGESKEKIIKKIGLFGLNNCVFVKNSINNVNEYLQAIDVLVMPSLYEGLPVIGVEAQAAGVKCFFSNTITKEAKILDKTEYINLNSSPDEWADIILEKIKNLESVDETKTLQNKGYDIKKESQKMENLYMKYIKEDKNGKQS